MNNAGQSRLTSEVRVVSRLMTCFSLAYDVSWLWGVNDGMLRGLGWPGFGSATGLPKGSEARGWPFVGSRWGQVFPSGASDLDPHRIPGLIGHR